MSPAEIEKLKALEREAAKGIGTGMYYESFVAAAHRQARDSAAGNALPRLLEERERLLEALRRCQWQPDFKGNLCCPVCYGHSLHNAGCALKSTLAFATAPTGKEPPGGR